MLALNCEINAGTYGLMEAALLTHQAAAYYDTDFAIRNKRNITLSEHHVHSFFEILPIVALSVTGGMHWGSLRKPPSKGAYCAIGAMIAIGFLPYLNETYRCVRAIRESKKSPLPRA
jgi:hypothetical protein